MPAQISLQNGKAEAAFALKPAWWNAAHTNCIANALTYTWKHGGQVRFGWYFLFRRSPDYGHYLIAVHHAVWHDPDTLMLVDVTPLNPDEKHQPIGQNSDTLFLLDDKARPLETGSLVVPLPSRFYAIDSSAGIQDYVERLQCEEYESYNQNYGASFR